MCSRATRARVKTVKGVHLSEKAKSHSKNQTTKRSHYFGCMEEAKITIILSMKERSRKFLFHNIGRVSDFTA